MKEDPPSEGGRNAGRQAIKHHAGVNPDVSFGMIFRGLAHAFHSRDFRQKLHEANQIRQGVQSRDARRLR